MRSTIRDQLEPLLSMRCARRATGSGLAIAFAAMLLAAAVPVAAQAAIEPARLEAYSKAYVEIGTLRDRYQAEAAIAQNKKPEAIAQLQEQLRADIARVLEQHGRTRDDYTHITCVVSTDAATRRALDLLLGIEPTDPPPEEPAARMHENAHVGHV